MSNNDDFELFKCGDHSRVVYMGCLSCDKRKDEQLELLQHDLATRDRELAEAHKLALEATTKLYAETGALDQARAACESAATAAANLLTRAETAEAALAEKEREVEALGFQWGEWEKAAHKANVALAAAQEEAK